MQFSFGIIEFFGIFVPGALFVGNSLVALLAGTSLWGTAAMSTATEAVGSETLIGLWLVVLSFAAGMCLRILRPSWAEWRHSAFNKMLDEWLKWPLDDEEKDLQRRDFASPPVELWNTYFFRSGSTKTDKEKRKLSRMRRFNFAKTIVVGRSERLGRQVQLAESYTRFMAGMLWSSLLGVALSAGVLVARQLAHPEAAFASVVFFGLINLVFLAFSIFGVPRLRENEAGMVLGSFHEVRAARFGQDAHIAAECSPESPKTSR